MTATAAQIQQLKALALIGIQSHGALREGDAIWHLMTAEQREEALKVRRGSLFIRRIASRAALVGSFG